MIALLIATVAVIVGLTMAWRVRARRRVPTAAELAVGHAYVARLDRHADELEREVTGKLYAALAGELRKPKR